MCSLSRVQTPHKIAIVLFPERTVETKGKKNGVTQACPYDARVHEHHFSPSNVLVGLVKSSICPKTRNFPCVYHYLSPILWLSALADRHCLGQYSGLIPLGYIHVETNDAPSEAKLLAPNVSLLHNPSTPSLRWSSSLAGLHIDLSTITLFSSARWVAANGGHQRLVHTCVHSKQ